jgi:hypothetical protein
MYGRVKTENKIVGWNATHKKLKRRAGLKQSDKEKCELGLDVNPG